VYDDVESTIYSRCIVLPADAPRNIRLRIYKKIEAPVYGEKMRMHLIYQKKSLEVKVKEA
jgi:hypothetical protein